MRAFPTVLKKLIDLAEDKELKESLNKVMVDASFTAPEALWDIRGEQVTVLLNDYLSKGTGRKDEWFAKVIRSLMDKYGERAPDVNESWHYKFEDLKPVFASEIQGGMDPNDEYYPRQKVDAAICELDAHRLCFDTDRKYYIEQYDKTLKRWMDSENRLLHSNYRRICRILKDCRKKLLEWQRLCTIFQDPKALEIAKAKVVLWQKWEARWQETANRYGGNYDG